MLGLDGSGDQDSDSVRLSALRWVWVSAVLLLAGVACAQSVPDSEVAVDSGAGREPSDVAPIDFDFKTSESSEECVEQRTGFDLADRDRIAGELSDGDSAPLYLSVDLACLIREGVEVPGPFRLSLLDDNGILRALAQCLVSDHSWSRSEDILDGVGGAVAPDVGAADKKQALLECGFDDPESLDDDPFANG